MVYSLPTKIYSMLSSTYITGITVVICTYNGALVLPPTLKHLAAQIMPSNFGWEVLLVSNASTDDTLAITSKLWTDLGNPTSLRVLNEPQAGKDYALAKGFSEASYPYVCIVDDDNWLAPDYLKLALDIMEANSQIGALGGTPEAVCEITPPNWFAQFAGHYAIGRQDPYSGDITGKQGFLCGAGCVIRQEAWQRVLAAKFETLLIHHPEGRLSGEDIEQCYVITLAGYRIWFDDRLKFKHFIPAKRLNWSYLCSIYKSSAAADVDLRPYRHFLYRSSEEYKKTLIWLRDALFVSKSMFKYKWRAIKSGCFRSAENTVGNKDVLNASFYWWSFQYYIKKQLRNDYAYERAERFIERMRMLPHLSKSTSNNPVYNDDVY